MSGKDEFEPLGETDFAVMQDRGKVAFVPRLRKELNGELELLCSPEGDQLVYREAKAAAEMHSSMARDAGNLLATLRKLEAALEASTDPRPEAAAAEPGARLASQRLFPTEWWYREETPEELRRLSPLTAKLEEFCRWVEHQASRLPRPKSIKGRPENFWRRNFILLIADAFEEAGGTVSASPDSMEGEDGKRRRNTPFIRVLLYIHERIPAHRRAPSNEALAEQADRLFADIKKQSKKPTKKSPKKPSRKKPNRGKKRG